VVGADLVEVSPPYDPTQITAMARAAMAYYIIELIVVAKERRKRGAT
jgi:arginase family enzyme